MECFVVFVVVYWLCRVKRPQHRLQIRCQGLSSPSLGTWERSCISSTPHYKRDDDARVLARAWVFLRVLARNLSIAKRENFKRLYVYRGTKT